MLHGLYVFISHLYSRSTGQPPQKLYSAPEQATLLGLELQVIISESLEQLSQVSQVVIKITPQHQGII